MALGGDGFYRAAREWAGATTGYSLLPCRFIHLDAERYLLTNFAGEYLVLSSDALHQFIRHELSPNAEEYRRLKARHFLLDGDSTVPIDLLAAKYRTRQAHLARSTSLFMVVTTLRCDHCCGYCQVSGRADREYSYDMTREVADATVSFIFRSPSPAIKIEFQGGESLLLFDMVKYIVSAVERENLIAQRDIAFVIATNLSPVTDEILTFCRDHHVAISTSLDGPRELHNANRPCPSRDSYEEAVRGIHRAQEALGADQISALMTTTRASLSHPEEIVDEYIRYGLGSVFLRTLHPYGRAATSSPANGYTTEEWLEFYRKALRYILAKNYEGVSLREEFSAILLRKMLTSWSCGYVDLQSPAGIGISGIVINHDGSVYVSDEARMLGEMGDRKFLMGNILTDRYEDIMLSEALLQPLSTTLTECMPQCADCGIQPYCGSDPVRHYRSQGDVIGFKPTSGFCKTHMESVKHLVHLLEDDPKAASVLRAWIQ